MLEPLKPSGGPKESYWLWLGLATAFAYGSKPVDGWHLKEKKNVQHTYFPVF